MTNNIVASISELLTPEIIGKLATASGLDRTMAGAAVEAAVPTILNGLADLVTHPGGARKLMSAVAQQSSDLESLSGSLIGSSQIAGNGNDLLSSLLGKKATNNFAAGIANLLGIRANAVQTLVGVVTPFVLAGLWRVQRAQGLDADGLARVLVEQKDNITSAIPDDLSSYLRRSGHPEGASAQRPPAQPEAQRAVSAITSSARRESDGAKSMSWPYWALALVALGGLLWALIPNQESEKSKTVSVSNESADRPAFVPATAGSVTYILRPEANWRSIGASSNEYVSRAIYNARGEELGTVRDLMMGPDGKAAAAVISVNRYLGIGDKVVAVPFTALRTERREGNPRLVVDLVKEALQSAPQYENAPASKP